MDAVKNMPKTTPDFTFHSGYIPIEKGYKNIKVLRELYIPFWIYSNIYKDTYTGGLCNFTFHSGYIPINFTVLNRKPYWPLHSILDIFQCLKMEYQMRQL